MKINKLRNYYREQGRIKATIEFESKLKTIINEHEKNIRKLEARYLTDVRRIDERSNKKELEYTESIYKNRELADGLNTKIAEISLMKSEAMDLYNDLKAALHNERINKSVKIEYAKSSLDYLDRKAGEMRQ